LIHLQAEELFRWKLPVTEGISTMGNFLFGGSGLGAAISALEGTSGRQCVWATGPRGLPRRRP